MSGGHQSSRPKQNRVRGPESLKQEKLLLYMEKSGKAFIQRPIGVRKQGYMEGKCSRKMKQSVQRP
jgi:hypothetical protein